MSSFSDFSTIFLLTVTCLTVTAFEVSKINETSPLDNGAVQTVTDVVEQTDETGTITPYEYKAVMLQNVPGMKLVCWRCSRPCNQIFCCNNGYPQCCILYPSGRCCCKR